MLSNRQREVNRAVDKGNISFRTLEIVAVALAVCAMAVGVIYWQLYGTKNPEITSKWLESGGIASVMAQLPDPKVAPKEFAASSDEIAVRKVGEEIISLRKADTQVFKAKDGQLTAHIYTAPINYLDKTDSTYKPIDTSTHQIADVAKSNPAKQFDEYINAGVYQATWFKDTPWDYKMFVGDSWIQYKALFDESSALSIKIDTLNTGLKETITLKDKTAPTKLQWTVTQSTGKSAIITPPPTAKDANGKEVKVFSYQIRDTLSYEVDTTDAVFPILVDPTSVLGSGDGWIWAGGSTFAQARDATSGGNTGNTQILIGQQNFQGNQFSVYRGFISFALPPMAALTACSLFLEGYGHYGTVDSDVYIHTSTYTPPPTASGDFIAFAGHQTTGAYNGTILNNTWNTSSYSATWNEFVFNASGLSAVFAKQNDTFKIALITKLDYDNTASDYGITTEVSFEPSTTAGKEPYLSITYTAPAVAPTVTTQSASLITDITATLNGNITNTGTADVTVRGFAYGTDATLATVISTTTDTVGQPFGTGAFTTAITGLTRGTNYYARAYATNSIGTGFGSIQALTSNLQSDVIIFRNNTILNNNVILK